MQVEYFRPQRPGPEVHIENAVASHLARLFPTERSPVWVAGSLPIGAGMPDLVAVSYQPEIIALANVDMRSADILAYLRVVNKARLDTITQRISAPRTRIVKCIDDLLEAEAILEDSLSFSIHPNWRSILPEIITIEAKVSDWRRGVKQAVRNRIFSHRSYLALPEKSADRVRHDEVFRRFGVGIIGVGASSEAKLVRRARRHQPKVWSYYYKLASMTAAYAGTGEHDAPKNLN